VSGGLVSIVTVVHDTKRSSYAIDDLPLAISHEASDVVLPAVASTSNAAFIDHEDGDFFLQAGAPSIVLVNGLPLETSRWIADGDELTLKTTRVLFRLTDGDLTVFVEPNKPAASIHLATPATQHSGNVEITAILFQPRWHTPPPQRSFRPSPRMIVIFAAFVVLTAGVWFVLTARAVRIETLPSTETVALEGGLTLKIGGRYLLRPGAYTVLAECPGYIALRSPLVVGKNTPAIVQYKLQPLGATLAIRSFPVSGAQFGSRLISSTIGSLPGSTSRSVSYGRCIAACSLMWWDPALSWWSSSGVVPTSTPSMETAAPLTGNDRIANVAPSG
jgi:hypothetical protein